SRGSCRYDGPWAAGSETPADRAAVAPPPRPSSVPRGSSSRGAPAAGDERRPGVAAGRPVENDARQPPDPPIGEQQTRALEVEDGGRRRRVEGAVLDHIVGARATEERLEPRHRGAARGRPKALRPERLEVAPEDVRLSEPVAIEKRRIDLGRGTGHDQHRSA